MIPSFTDDGILPPGRHLATTEEVEHRLVMPFPSSMTRKDIFDGWLRRREELLELVEVEAEWLDGSFVTLKRDPGDIDVVVLLREEVVDALDLKARQRVSQLVAGAHPRLAFGCHSFPLIICDEGRPSHDQYLRFRGYWDRWWGHHDGEFDRKGYLDVRAQK